MALKFLSPTHLNKIITYIRYHILYHQHLLCITCLRKPSSKQWAKIAVCSVLKDGALGSCLPTTKSPKFIFSLIVEITSFLHISPSLSDQKSLQNNCFLFLKESCDCSQQIDLFPPILKVLPLFWWRFGNGTVAALLKYLQLHDFCGL